MGIGGDQLAEHRLSRLLTPQLAPVEEEALLGGQAVAQFAILGMFLQITLQGGVGQRKAAYVGQILTRLQRPIQEQGRVNVDREGGAGRVKMIVSDRLAPASQIALEAKLASAQTVAQIVVRTDVQAGVVDPLVRGAT